MLRALPWRSIVAGSVAGLATGLVLTLVTGAGDASAGIQVTIQFVAFAVAGAVTGLIAPVARIASGGFAALALYFVLAGVSVSVGADLHPMAILVFGVLAILIGTGGAALVHVARRS